jgi:hypothetical protein
LPHSVDEVMPLQEYHRPVEAIWTVPDGKYQKITKYRFGKPREPGEDDDEETINKEENEETKEAEEQFEDWDDLPF